MNANALENPRRPARGWLVVELIGTALLFAPMLLVSGVAWLLGIAGGGTPPAYVPWMMGAIVATPNVLLMGLVLRFIGRRHGLRVLQGIGPFLVALTVVATAGAVWFYCVFAR